MSAWFIKQHVTSRDEKEAIVPLKEKRRRVCQFSVAMHCCDTRYRQQQRLDHGSPRLIVQTESMALQHRHCTPVTKIQVFQEMLNVGLQFHANRILRLHEWRTVPGCRR
ncbi:MAG TPA: hypothetical protein VK663_06630 [Burkholderiales bacterium]|nr:hypothetical protein [Burkholderiales bacterium]